MWGEAFKNLLAGYKRGQGYAPAFRLQIGSCMIVGDHVGAWEEDKGMKALEISSHPASSSIAPSETGDSAWDTENPLYKRTKTDLGYEYLYTVGLTGEITMGAQSVHPRTFVYTPATLRVGVSQFAASCAQQMTLGTMACLQINIETFNQKETRGAGWNNIFFGSFQGVSWNGRQYVLTFADALNLAKFNSTQKQTYAGWNIEMFPNWFAGCGTTSKTKSHSTITSFTGTDWRTQALFATRQADRMLFGFTYKKIGAEFSGHSYLPHWAHASKTSDANQGWAKVASTTRGEYINYEETLEHEGNIWLNDCRSMLTTDGGLGWIGYMPGYFEHAASAVVGAGAADKHITAYCVLSGSPISEYVNTVYIQGYHPFMVPGIFADKMGGEYRKDIINWDDISTAQNDFSKQWTKLTGTKGWEDRMSQLKANVTEQANGLSFMNKIVGKWGCHPRFKEGGYGMSCYPSFILGSGYDTWHWDEFSTRSERNAMITGDDIEGAEMQMVNPQTKGSYRRIRYITKAVDRGDDTKTENDVAIYTGDPDNVRDAPLQWELIVDTSDCAEGYLDGTAERYATYIEGCHRNVYARSHMSATLRLNGFKHAHLAPGDFVDVSIERDGAFSFIADWGPVDSIPHSKTSSLNTIKTTYGIDGEPSSSRVRVPWRVVSSHVDWMKCLVTIGVTRVNDADGTATGRFWDASLDTHQRRGESRDMGMPTFKKSGK